MFFLSNLIIFSVFLIGILVLMFKVVCLLRLFMVSIGGLLFLVVLKVFFCILILSYDVFGVGLRLEGFMLSVLVRVIIVWGDGMFVFLMKWLMVCFEIVLFFGMKLEVCFVRFDWLYLCSVRYFLIFLVKILCLVLVVLCDMLLIGLFVIVIFVFI